MNVKCAGEDMFSFNNLYHFYSAVLKKSARVCYNMKNS